MSDLLRKKKLQMEAAEAREAMLSGRQDAIEGRATVFKGRLRQLLKKSRP